MSNLMSYDEFQRQKKKHPPQDCFPEVCIQCRLMETLEDEFTRTGKLYQKLREHDLLDEYIAENEDEGNLGRHMGREAEESLHGRDMIPEH